MRAADLVSVSGGRSLHRIITADAFSESRRCMRRGCRLVKDREVGGSREFGYEQRFRKMQYRELVSYAHRRSPDIVVDGTDPGAEYPDLIAAHRRTVELMRERVPIADGWFVSNDCAALIPILAPTSGTDGWDLEFIHPAARTKARHIQEAAFARACLASAGVRVENVRLLSVNRNYIRKISVDVSELFLVEDISLLTARMLESVEATTNELRAALDSPTETLPLCHRPAGCSACRPALPELPKHNLFTLYHGTDLSQELFRERVIDLRDLPTNISLSERQKIQLQAVRSGEPQIDVPGLERFLANILYPLSFLDFETYSVSVPPFPGMRPWQHVPFLYSLHLQESEAADAIRAGHMEPAGKDGRRELLESLIESIYSTGSVVVFGSNFERSMLNSLAEAFPEYRAAVDTITPRIVDLSVPFQSFLYYHPDQLGRMSLKSILPALTGFGYENLMFSDGLEASVAYYLSSHGAAAKTTDSPAVGAERELIRRSLSEYCAMDTGGLVSILRVLQDAVRTK